METATQVYNALKSHLNAQNKTIDIWTASADAALKPLAAVLKLFGISASYTVTAVDLNPVADDTVTLLGEGVFNQPGATAAANKFSISVTLTYSATTGLFNLSFTITTPALQLSSFFLSLPGTLRANDLGTPGPSAITWHDSCLADMKIKDAVFSASSAEDALLSLSGLLLQPTDPNIQTRLFLLGNWPLKLSGSVVMPADAAAPPILNLEASGNNLTLTANQEGGVEGPSAFPIKSVGLMLIVEELASPQFDHTHFSTLRIFGVVELGGITGKISTLILSSDSTWSFRVTFSKNATMVQGLSQLSQLFGVDLPVPMNFPVLSDFYVAEIDIDLNNENAHGAMPSFSLGGFAITIRSDKTWNPPVPFVTISNVGTRWAWVWTMVNSSSQPGKLEKSYLLSGAVFGSLNFGGTPPDGGNLLPPPDDSGSPGSAPVLSNNRTSLATAGQSVTLDVKLTIPDFYIYGNMKAGDYIPIGKAFEYFFGHSGPSTASSMNVTQFSFTADPIGQNYSGQAVIVFGDPSAPEPNQGWDIDLLITTITLQELDLFIAAEGGKISGGISAIFLLDDGADINDYKKPRMMISAKYPTQDPQHAVGWEFAGYLYPGTSIDLTTLVKKLITGKAGKAPDWIPDLNVDRLYGEFSTGSKAYKFGGTISALWSPEIFGTKLKIAAAASVDMIKLESAKEASGKISGQFSVNKIALSAAMNFGDPEPTYQFKIQFDQLWLEAVTSWRGTAKERHQVVSIQLGGVTLGDMIEYLVNLAAPTLGFQLDSPWDALKRINLSSFVLTIDPKENTVEFVFKANVNLAIMQIDSVGIRYTKNTGAGKVNMILTGDFVGKKYSDEKPLSWDVINDPPPAVPGAGKSLVDLRYLGVGQRITFNKSDADLPNTVAESIALLRESMKPVSRDSNKSPIEGQKGIKYSGDSQWLIGLDISLMETVALGIIFNDPRLYGLSIALSGEKAGSMAGLRFELLYKKITNDVGMFRVELKVPDQFRTIQLGAASLTLGIIVVEVYTNGNFKVDLGFPYNRDFGRAFSLSASIFIGRGGIYFGLLDGDTSTQVPKITNGHFSPVLELGLGIAAGVGKELHAGLFSGGIYVELEVVFQGVLGWFHPTNSGDPSAKFFACKGIVAIHGKVYGAVDFGIIKASVSIDAYAQALVIYQCYEPTVFQLSAEVSAEAKIKIVFVTIHFSFKFHLETSFTLGSSKPTPWILAPGSGKGGFGARPRISPPLRKAHLKTRHMAALRMVALVEAKALTPDITSLTSNADYNLVWTPANNVFGVDTPQKAHLTMLPLFSVGNVPVSWDSNIPANQKPDYRAAFVLSADTGITPSAQGADECTERCGKLSAMMTTDTGTENLAADLLVKGLFLYAVNALPRPASEKDMITAGQLAHLEEELGMKETLDTGFSLSNLAIFFENNINLLLSGDPGGTPDEKGAMVFPMPPWLSFAITTAAGKSAVDFMSKNKIGPFYEWGISEILANYSPVNEGHSTKPTEDKPDKYESFSSFMFRDFCLMIAKNAVKEAEKNMTQTSLAVTEDANKNTPSLVTLAGSLPTAIVSYTVSAGNTIDRVAAILGSTVEELLLLNPNLETDIQTSPPGTVIDVTIGVAAETLAEDNAEIALTKGQWKLGTIYHQVVGGETLAAVATLFNASVPAILSFSNTRRVNLNEDPNLLLANSTFNLDARTYTSPAGAKKERVAATFFTRYLSQQALSVPGGPDIAGWYAEAIAKINVDKLAGFSFGDGELIPGNTLKVPSSYNTAYTTASNCNDYITVAGDSLLRIGATLALQQDDAINPETKAKWTAFSTATVSPSADTWTIPAITGVAVQIAETVESLSRRLIIDATYAGNSWTYNWNDVALWLAPAKVIAALAVVTVPDAKTADDTFTFKQLSTVYGIGIVDLVETLKEQDNLFPNKTTLTVNHLPAQKISVLVDAVLKGASFTNIVNQSSRMLLAGLQLPALKVGPDHTIPDPTKPEPLYDLTGQQFDVTVDSAKPTDNALTVVSSSSASWIQQMDSITCAKGTTLEQMQALEKQYPDLQANNPSIKNFSYPLTSSVVLLTQSAPKLNYSYSNKELLAHAPATGLAVYPALDVLPKASWPMPLSGDVVQAYNFEHRIDLQTPTPLAVAALSDSTNVSGLPSLWPFPESFIHQAEIGASSDYEILSSTVTGAAARHANALQHTTYATMIPFRISKLDGGTTQFNLLGVDTDKRHLLLALKKQLASEKPGTLSYLLLSPAPNASNATGTTVISSAADTTYLIKSNLSTESVPQPTGGISFLALPTTSYSAPLSSLAEFLLLLWEGSVVGGTGYYFGMKEKLPGSAFDSRGVATLQLMVITESQQAVADKGRKLLPFNNTLVVGPGLANAIHALYAESYGDTDMTRKALLPPGNIGFRVATDKPVDVQDAGKEKEVHLRKLYSLMSFSIDSTTGSPFVAPASGMPSLPKPWDGSQQSLPQIERSARRARQNGQALATPDMDYWLYDQVLPAYKFVTSATPMAVPDVTGLPSIKNDPYAGLGLEAAIPNAHFSFGFGDILGNRSAPPAKGEGVLAAPGGYTDDLIAIGEWPSTAYTYNINASAQLTVTVAARPAELAPNSAQAGDYCVTGAQKQAEKYAQSYYQLVQGNINGYIHTTLKHNDSGIKLDAIEPLIQFAAGAYAHANTTALLSTKQATSSTLSDVISNHHIRYVELAEANADTLVQSLFETPASIIVPSYFPYIQNDSISDLYELHKNSWPSVTPTELLGYPENTSLPLKVGAVLVIPTVKISTGTGIQAIALTKLAQDNNTSVPLLAQENKDQSVLSDGFIFSTDTGNDQIVTVTSNTTTLDSLQKIANAFSSQYGVNLSIAELVKPYESDEKLLAVGKNLNSSSYVVKDGDTLATNASSAKLTDLISNNLDTLNIFDPGALVFFGDYKNISFGDVPPTLRQFADDYACPMELFLLANKAQTVAAINIPGVFDWPKDTGSLTLPYTIMSNDTLTSIAEKFATSEADGGLIASANANMPGILTTKPLTITVKATGKKYPITPAAGSTLNAVLAQLKAVDDKGVFQDVITAISTEAGVLNNAALLICPLAKLKIDSTPTQVSDAYGLSAGAFALANTATPDLILPVPALKSTDGLVTVASYAGDTFNTLIVRFSEKGVKMSSADIAVANATVAFLKKDAPVLLPPTDAKLTVDVGTVGPYPGPVFPLDVSLRVERPSALVAEGFDNTGPVAQARSTIPAPAHDDKNKHASLTFDNFVKDMKKAFRNLRLGTGKVEGQTSDLWCVDFTANGIKDVSLTGGTTITINDKPIAQPAYYALKPLCESLVYRTGISIKPLTATGILGTAVPTNYQGIDVELWASRFLSDFDRVLSGPYAAAIYENSTINAKLNTLIENKKTLITAITSRLDTLLDLPPAGNNAPLDSAKVSMNQQLGVSLSHAFETSVVIQYNSTVDSSWQKASPPLPASFYGDGAIGNAPAGAVTMIASKTPLNDAASYVNFLTTVQDPSKHKEISGQFNYNISHLEFDIEPVAESNGYVSSNWIDFLPLLTGAEKPKALEKTDPSPAIHTPIPLRIFPGLPVIKDQAALGLPNPTELADYSLWDYQLSYAHEHAEQDFVIITVEYNLKKKPVLRALVETKDLFAELAQYMQVADELWNNLGGLVDQETKIPKITIENSVNTLSDLIGNIASCWQYTIEPSSAGTGGDDQYTPESYATFEARINYTDQTYTLTVIDKQLAAGTELTWPSVTYMNDEGKEFVLTASSPVNNTVTYSSPDDPFSSDSAWPGFELSFDKLNVSETQNARASIAVERNQSLIANSDVKTKSAFLFKTADVKTSGIATPLLVSASRLQMQGSSLAVAIDNTIATLFPVSNRLPNLNLTHGIFYAYELNKDEADPDKSLITKLPVALYPDKAIGSSFGKELSGIVTQWETANKPSEENGEWVFSMILYSDSKTEKLPLLSLEQLYYQAD